MAKGLGKMIGIGVIAVFAIVVVLFATGVVQLPVAPGAIPPTDEKEELEPGVCTATSIQFNVKGKQSINTGTNVEDINAWIYKNGNFISEQRLSSDSSFDVQPGTVKNPVNLEVVLFDDDATMTYYGQKISNISIGCVDKAINPLIDEIGTIGVTVYNDDGNGNSVSQPKPFKDGGVTIEFLLLFEGATADKVFGGTGIVSCYDYNNLEVEKLTLSDATGTSTPSGHTISTLDRSTTQCFKHNKTQFVDTTDDKEYTLEVLGKDLVNPAGPSESDIEITVYDECIFQDDAGNWVNVVRDPDTSGTICGTDGNYLAVYRN